MKGFLRSRPLLLLLALLLLPKAFLAQTSVAPGAPGKDAQWATAGKQGVGTANTLASKVWFTLAQGVMTEVYYPDVTQANVHLLQFVVVNSKTKKVETEQADAIHEIKVEPIYINKNVSPIENIPVKKTFESQVSLSFTQITRSKAKSENGANLSGFVIGGEASAWTITKNYVTNSENNSVVFSVEFKTNDPDYELYLYYDPSLSNSGMGDTGWTKENTLIAKDNDVFSALSCRYCKFSETTNGFLEVNDGLTQLRKSGKIENAFSRAENGNVVQTARITPTLSAGNKKNFNFEISLGFGKTENEAVKASTDSLLTGFANVKAKYQKEWSDYLKTVGKVDPRYQAQFNMAAMILRAHEDKTNRGANIASLSIPWGGGANANENTVAGYHLVWSRDLYQVATAFMALGDKDAAVRALDFLFKVQQRPDGSFPQNSFLDGKPFWGSLQLDEVAYPLILAYQLERDDRATYENHVKKAADFIVKNGPRTPQERWEEEAGFSPSTIAAEIAGLVCAANIARKNGDEASAVIYLAAADDWARKVETWTATTTGKYGDGNYYLRITQNGRPDAGEKIELNNGAGFFDEREIVDAGFLELVRLGIKRADDPLIVKSLKVIDEVIRVNTPNGEAFYRYNHDGYGEMEDGRRWNWDGKYTGKGRLWALLAGERGQYELARFDPKGPVKDGITWKDRATRRLDAMSKFANDGLMIPEQIWDKREIPKNIDRQFIPELRFGEGTGSATPLAWSMAQFIRLAVNLQERRNLETPDIVYERYARGGIPGQTSGYGGLDQDSVLPVRAGEKFSFKRDAPKGSKAAYIYAGKTYFAEVGDERKVPIEIVAPDAEETAVFAIMTPDGSSAFERIKVRAVDKPAPQKFSAETIEKIKASKASPLIENGKAILFYRGEAQSVQAAGDFSDWNPRIALTKIGDNLFAREMDLAPTARSEYKFVVDGKWITDPLNPNVLEVGGDNRNSVLAMPEYQPTKWTSLGYDEATGTIAPLDPAKPSIEEFEIETKKFGKRAVKVYLPRDYKQSKAAFPVLYLHDGSDYLEKASAIFVQESLVRNKKIKPFIIAAIDSKDRGKEYWANDDWADFIAGELVPEIDRRYRTVSDREGRAVLGASLGGATSLWIGWRHPETFARIGGQSSSFWIDNERVVKALEKLDAGKTKFRFYLDDGALEGAEDTRRVNLLLRAKGYPVTYLEAETGHNWTAWRDRLAQAMIALWQ